MAHTARNLHITLTGGRVDECDPLSYRYRNGKLKQNSLKLSYITSMTAESSAYDFVRPPEDDPNLCSFSLTRLPLDTTGTLRITHSKLTHNTRYANRTHRWIILVNTPQITQAFTSYTPHTSFKGNGHVSLDLFGAIRRLRIVKVFTFRNDHGAFETSVSRLFISRLGVTFQ
jgi:hypothetical protein